MVFTIISSFAVSSGTVLQKRAFLADFALPEEQRHRKRFGLLFSKTWLWGLVCMILQIPFTIAALAMAPQSLVNPLGAGCTIVLSLLLAVFLLGEKMGQSEFVGSGLIICGVILTTVANAGGGKKLHACEIVNRFGSADFLGITLALVVFLVVSVLVIRNKDKIHRANLLTVLIAFTAGGMAALLNVFLKVLGEFTQAAIAGEEAAIGVWSTIHPYYSLLLVILMAFGMISFISQGLEHSVAVLFLPVYNCLFIVLSSVMGGVFFQEFDHLSSLGVTLFPTGIVVIVVGIMTSISGSANMSAYRPHMPHQINNLMTRNNNPKRRISALDDKTDSLVADSSQKIEATDSQDTRT